MRCFRDKIFFQLNFTQNKRHPFACHRFDQSLFSILVYNHYKFDAERFRIFGIKKDFMGMADRSLPQQIKDNNQAIYEKTGVMPPKPPHPPPERSSWMQDLVESDAYRGPNRDKEELERLGL